MGLAALVHSALAVQAAACGGDTRVTTRAVTLHVPAACKVGGSGFAQYFELGDFEPTPPSTGHLLGQAGETLSEVSDQARALVAEATQSGGTWSGTTRVAPSGPIDVLVLPELRSCELSGTLGARASASPSTMAVVADNRVLVIGGAPGTSTPPPSYVADMNRGVIAAVTPDLTTPRNGASATAFGAGALVAGGSNRQGTVLATAERYSGQGGFDQARPIALSEPRADHGAVVLASGETLLVGGVGSDGKTVLASMEIVDPATSTVREQNVALLASPRRSPTVLRLASGEVMVAGGTDTAGAPVTRIEWFSPDASRASKVPQDLVAGSAHAFTALGGGGALAVIAPPAGADATFQTVWMIDASGAIEAAAPLPGVVAPVLFTGTLGAPVLWTGSSPGGTDGRWLRWQPWQGAFGALGALDPAPARITDATASPDPGLAAWLDDGAGSDARLTALRFDVRGDYSTLPGPLLVDSTAELAPDRLVSAQNLSFDPSAGLALSGDATAFVTDRTYADVSIDMDAPTGEPALVVLRDQAGVELEVGGVSCPGALAAGSSPSSLHVERSGATVTWSVAHGASGTCRAGVQSGARLSVGVRGARASPGRSVARNLRVVRLGS